MAFTGSPFRIPLRLGAPYDRGDSGRRGMLALVNRRYEALIDLGNYDPHDRKALNCIAIRPHDQSKRRLARLAEWDVVVRLTGRVGLAGRLAPRQCRGVTGGAEATASPGLVHRSFPAVI